MSASANDKNLALMREMGASSYDPIPPDQYLCFLDPDVRLSDRGHRAHSWLKSKTIHPDERRRRWTRAHDRRGDLKLKHLAADLDWDTSAATKAWAELEAEGIARKDEDERLWMCGTVQRRAMGINGEDSKESLFVQKVPEALRLYFQSLEKSVRDSAEARYFAAVRYTKQLEADAMAAARSAGYEVMENVLNAIGYTEEKGHGRPRVNRELLVQLSLASGFEDYFVQTAADGSAQNGNGHVHKTENGSVQAAHPYSLSESESEGSSSSVTESVPVVETTTSPLPSNGGQAAKPESPAEKKTEPLNGKAGPESNALIHAAMADTWKAGLDEHALRRLWQNSRAKRRGCTEQQIANAIRTVFAKAKHLTIDSVPAYLWEAVPNELEASRRAEESSRRPGHAPPPAVALTPKEELRSLEQWLAAFGADHLQGAEVEERAAALRAQLAGAKTKGAAS